MTKVDQFESIFRSAAKESLRYQRPAIATAVLVTDLDAYATDRLLGRVRTFLGCLEDVTWAAVDGTQFRTVPEMLEQIEPHRADLVVTYRHLHTEGWRHRLTLGDHAEVLTQAIGTPILLIPHPERDGELAENVLRDTKVVLAITDHLATEHRLVNWAARMTQPRGTLWLTHVEDELSLIHI